MPGQDASRFVQGLGRYLRVALLTAYPPAVKMTPYLLPAYRFPLLDRHVYWSVCVFEVFL